MRLWILFGCGVLILGAAIWPFGRRTEQLAPVPVPPAVAVKPAPPVPSKPELAKIVEVIDLARAYEPVREPEEAAGTVNPATFIEVPEQPKPIPPAGELIDVMPRVVEELVSPPEGTYSLDERLGVLPREVSQNPYRGLLDEIRKSTAGPAWSLNDVSDPDDTSADWPAWDVAIDPIWSPLQRPSYFIPELHSESGIFFEKMRLSEQLIAVRSMVLIDGPSDAGRERAAIEQACTTYLDVMPREVK
jgi:hypothetical protein